LAIFVDLSCGATTRSIFLFQLGDAADMIAV